MKKLFRRIKVSPAMVVAIIALVMATAGGAVAASSLTQSQFKKKGVRGPVTYVSTVFTVPGNTFARGQALCDPGQVPLGGGAQISNEQTDFLNSSFPSGNGWVASVFNATATPHSATAWAVCAKARSG